MRPGNVVRLRVNPTDSISVLDVIEKANLRMDGMSYAQCVSLALASLLETCRQQGIIPTRDGTEYYEKMAPFKNGRYVSQGKKLEITKSIQSLGSEFKAPVVEEDIATSQRTIVVPASPPASMEERVARTRLRELIQRKDLAEAPGNDVHWSASDQEEYDECYRIVYPEG